MITFFIVEFAVSVAIGWIWQSLRDYRLLARFTPYLFVPTIANTAPPSIGEATAMRWLDVGEDSGLEQILDKFREAFPQTGEPVSPGTPGAALTRSDSDPEEAS